MTPNNEVDCDKLATYLSDNCRDLIEVLRFFVRIGATSIIDKIAHASSPEDLRNILSDEVTRVLESIRRSAHVDAEGRGIYKEEVRDRDVAYFKSLGVLKEEGGKKYIVVVVPSNPKESDLKVIEKAVKECGVTDVASTLALLARVRPR